MPLRFSDFENLLSIDNGFDDWANGRPKPIFAKSPAYNVLRRELKRYLGKEIRGRSFLVSGHRGSGKTTLVLRAIEDLYSDPISVGRDHQRPLLVKLHGPTILDPSIGAGVSQPGEGEDEKKGNAANSAGNGGGKDCHSTAQAVLIQVTIALYRSLSAEVSKCYRRALYRTARTNDLPDAHEHVGQLCLELDNAPDPALLREFWARAGALRQGVFWAPDPDDPNPGSPYLDKGIKELVAISTAAQAYRVVSGSVTEKREGSENANIETSSETSAKVPMADVAKPILSVIAGGLVGGATLLEGWSHAVLAAGVGLATIVITSMTLSLTTKRSRKKSISTEHTFIRDRTVETLDRELPTVIERIREAGLAPVFVVDELDKVTELDKHMAVLVERLKHLVADSSFFCFLTDRDYFEDLREKSRIVAYPKEHTYFSHRLFVLYRPSDLQEYLERLIQIEGPSDANNDNHRFAVTYLLKHRAMMHTFDLQRELAKISDDSGLIEVSWDQIKSQLGYRYHMMIQMAVEHLLGEAELRERLEQDAQFGQLVYDALYMPSRSWLAGDEELNVSDDEIERYLWRRLLPLSRRTGREEADTKTAKNGAEPGTKNADNSDGNLLTGLVRDTDRTYLIALVRKLVSMLVDPESIRAMVSDRAFKSRSDTDVNPLTSLVQTIPGSGGSANAGDANELDNPAEAGDGGTAPNDRRLLVEISADPPVYRWFRDPFGRHLLREGETEAQFIDIGIQQADNEFLEELSDFLSYVGGPELDPAALGDFGVIPVSPTWDFVDRARARLTEFRETARHYDEVVADQEVVREFVDLLSNHGEQILQALSAARLVSREAALPGSHEDLFSSLYSLCRLLDLPNNDSQQVRMRLSDFCEAQGLVAKLKSPLRPDTLHEWFSRYTELKTIVDARPTGDLQSHRETAWQEWQRQLLVYSSSGGFEPSFGLSRAVCLAARVTPMEWSVRSPELLTIREASGLLVNAIKGFEPESPEFVPFWAVPSMLRHLQILQLGDSVRGFFEKIAGLTKSETIQAGIEEAMTQLDDWDSATDPDLYRSVAVILTSADGGAADNWLRSDQYGALMVATSDLPSEAGADGMPILELVLAAQPRVAIFDLHHLSEREVEEVLERGEIDLGEEVSILPTVYLSQQTAELRRQFPDWNFVGPEGLDEAMRTAISLLERDSDKTSQAQTMTEVDVEATTPRKARKKPAKKKSSRRKPRKR